MKRLLFYAGIVFMLSSCAMWLPDTTVINASSHTVILADNEVLNPGTMSTINYNVTSVLIKSPKKRVTQTKDGNTITIIDLPSWEVNAENKTANAVTLAADGWMDDLTVTANSTSSGKVYTNNPQFSVKSNNFPYDVKWNFTNNIFYVTIRN